MICKGLRKTHALALKLACLINATRCLALCDLLHFLSQMPTTQLRNRAVARHARVWTYRHGTASDATNHLEMSHFEDEHLLGLVLCASNHPAMLGCVFSYDQ